MPGGTAAKIYTIEASYSGGMNFLASTGTAVLTVMPSTSPEPDDDGVDDATENGAPNDGDGDGDGVADMMQTTVTSLPSATTSEFITLETTGVGCENLGVVATDPAAMPADTAVEASFVQVQGLLSFRLECAAATVRLIYHGEESCAGVAYRKYGRTPLAPATSQWCTLPAVFGTANIGGATVATVTLELADGELGDDDVTVNGTIVDPGGPAMVVGGIPTLSQWGLMLLGLLLALAGARSLRQHG